ncbi:MAG TPA: hypothetical protein VLK22_03970 [Candidatus Udaeobacter sp.]|nr:hypothetical protein [Candidatus Udaeobacter sp.]
MHKQLTTFIVLLWASLFFLCSPAQAHELMADGSIYALLHINPDDDPIVGQPADLLFLITDAKKTFVPDNCNCIASITDLTTNKIIFSSPLSKSRSSYKGIFAPAITYTFPHKGIYTIKLTGTPIQTNSFQSFNLAYDIRLDKDSTAVKSSAQINWLFYAATTVMLGAIIYLTKKIFTNK